MKNIKITIAAIALCALAACASSEPKQFTGFIVDASMNTVVVKDLTSDQTYSFSTMDADRAQTNNMLIGAPIVVEYKGELKDGVAATKVTTDATYAEAVGKWTMPDPINPEGVMGVELMVEGAAQSINMATLPYSSWELQGEAGKIILKGQSIGNGQTFDISEVGVISKNGEGVYTLAIEGTEVVYTKSDQ